jgi:hypothetical protein
MRTRTGSFLTRCWSKRDSNSGSHPDGAVHISVLARWRLYATGAVFTVRRRSFEEMPMSLFSAPGKPHLLGLLGIGPDRLFRACFGRAIPCSAAA